MTYRKNRKQFQIECITQKTDKLKAQTIDRIEAARQRDFTDIIGDYRFPIDRDKILEREIGF